MNKFLVHRDKTEESSYKVLKRQTMLKCIHKILLWGDFWTTLPGSGSSDRVTGSRSTPALQISSYRHATHQRQDKKITRDPCVRRLEATFFPKHNTIWSEFKSPRNQNKPQTEGLNEAVELTFTLTLTSSLQARWPWTLGNSRGLKCAMVTEPCAVVLVRVS